MARLPDLHIPSTEIINSTEIECYLRAESRYCVIGTSIFLVQHGRLQLFFSGLPLQLRDTVKVSPFTFD